MTTGKLCCDLDDLYRIASHMIGRPMWTHELPRAFELCAPDLKAQFPELASITGDDITRNSVHEWVAARVAEFGATRDVKPLGWNRLEEQSPFDTLAEMVPAEKIVLVTR